MFFHVVQTFNFIRVCVRTRLFAQGPFNAGGYLFLSQDQDPARFVLPVWWNITMFPEKPLVYKADVPEHPYKFPFKLLTDLLKSSVSPGREQILQTMGIDSR